MFEQVLSAIQSFDRIIIHRHKNPDGDALGSQIGLKHILKENFPEKEVYMVGDRAGRYAFMEDSVMDEIPDELYSGALAVILDTSAKHLISDERYPLAEKTVRIDHHIFCETIADVEVTDTAYESCCGLITEFALECGLKLNLLAARSLYSSNTFRLASALMAQPFDTGEIYSNLYADDLENVKNKAHFLLKIQKTEKPVAYIYTDLEEVRSLGMDTFSMSRGMVGTMADIKGVPIWVNFTETEQGVLCELRSNRYNINPIAVKYGGGGHAKASGACVANKEIAMQMLSDLNALTKE